MHGEIITIGSELVSGRTLDLNSWYAAGRLTASGLSVTRITSVGDDKEEICEALRKALQSSRFVIVTGGLGSTDDDITSEAVACALNRPLSRDQEMYSLIKGFAGARGMEITSYLEIFQNRALRKDAAALGAQYDSCLGPPGGLVIHDVPTLEFQLATNGDPLSARLVFFPLYVLHDPRKGIHEGGLAGAVGPKDSNDLIGAA